MAAWLTGGGTCFALVAIQRTAGRSVQGSDALRRVFSWLAIGPAVSSFIGPFVSGALIDLAGFRAAFAFLTVLRLATLWWARRVPPAEGRGAASGGTAWAVGGFVSAGARTWKRPRPPARDQGRRRCLAARLRKRPTSTASRRPPSTGHG